MLHNTTVRVTPTSYTFAISDTLADGSELEFSFKVDINNLSNILAPMAFMAPAARDVLKTVTFFMQIPCQLIHKRPGLGHDVMTCNRTYATVHGNQITFTGFNGYGISCIISSYIDMMGHIGDMLNHNPIVLADYQVKHQTFDGKKSPRDVIGCYTPELDKTRPVITVIGTTASLTAYGTQVIDSQLITDTTGPATISYWVADEHGHWMPAINTQLDPGVTPGHLNGYR